MFWRMILPMTDKIFDVANYHIKNFRERKGRLLGVDFGEKRVGLAVSDDLQEIAVPLSVVENNQKLFAEIEKIIKEYKIVGIIVGFPMHLDGKKSEISDLVLKFSCELRRLFGLEMAFWDERLTSSSAEKMLLAADFSRKKRKQVIDKVAACYILQSALDYFKFNRD